MSSPPLLSRRHGCVINEILKIIQLQRSLHTVSYRGCLSRVRSDPPVLAGVKLSNVPVPLELYDFLIGELSPRDLKELSLIGMTLSHVPVPLEFYELLTGELSPCYLKE